jgi:hypothetical protein
MTGEEEATVAAQLSVLADGFIPADHRDAGAAAVGAGPRLAQRMAAGVNADLYREGLRAAAAIAQEQFGQRLAELSAEERPNLLELLRAAAPMFYKQLRMDVSAMYLSDPGVWARIGFPGPSTESGGYPDFDQPQT